MIFLGIYWEFFVEFFVQRYLNKKAINLFVKIWFLLRFCLNGEGRKDKKFRSLEVQEASSSNLKRYKFANVSIQQQELKPRYMSIVILITQQENIRCRKLLEILRPSKIGGKDWNLSLLSKRIRIGAIRLL